MKASIKKPLVVRKNLFDDFNVIEKNVKNRKKPKITRKLCHNKTDSMNKKTALMIKELKTDTNQEQSYVVANSIEQKIGLESALSVVSDGSVKKDFNKVGRKQYVKIPSQSIFDKNIGISLIQNKVKLMNASKLKFASLSNVSNQIESVLNQNLNIQKRIIMETSVSNENVSDKNEAKHLLRSGNKYNRRNNSVDLCNQSQLFNVKNQSGSEISIFKFKDRSKVKLTRALTTASMNAKSFEKSKTSTLNAEFENKNSHNQQNIQCSRYKDKLIGFENIRCSYDHLNTKTLTIEKKLQARNLKSKNEKEIEIFENLSANELQDKITALKARKAQSMNMKTSYKDYLIRYDLQINWNL